MGWFLFYYILRTAAANVEAETPVFVRSAHGGRPIRTMITRSNDIINNEIHHRKDFLNKPALDSFGLNNCFSTGIGPQLANKATLLKPVPQ